MQWRCRQQRPDGTRRTSPCPGRAPPETRPAGCLPRRWCPEPFLSVRPGGKSRLIPSIKLRRHRHGQKNVARSHFLDTPGRLFCKIWPVLCQPHQLRCLRQIRFDQRRLSLQAFSQKRAFCIHHSKDIAFPQAVEEIPVSPKGKRRVGTLPPKERTSPAFSG